LIIKNESQHYEIKCSTPNIDRLAARGFIFERVGVVGFARIPGGFIHEGILANPTAFKSQH
jgi:hypothetical protein